MKSPLLNIVILISLIGCTKENHYNESASPSGDSLAVKALEGKVITSSINKRTRTMSVLYGNDIAASYIGTSSTNYYPAGAELSLVTWTQKEDVHWFGADIPGTIKMVEIIKFPTSGNIAIPDYALYAGSPLRFQKQTDHQEAKKRTEYISSQKASVMP